MKRMTILAFCFYFFLIGCQPNTTEVTDETKATDETAIDESSVTTAVENASEDDYKTLASAFITLVEKEDIKAIAAETSYPLSRQYPLPDIKNAAEFIEQYHAIFDGKLREDIITSDVEKDWTKMGYQGIMLSNGTLWLGEKGNLIAINDLSDSEKKKRTALIAKDKVSIHKSLQKFDEPVAIMETEKFRVRIDEVDGKYRYASWEIGQKQSEKPDLIVNDGEMIRDGSGGNHHYLFKNGDYTYQCDIIVMGESSSPVGRLNINKSDKEILSADIVSLEH